MSLIEYTLFGKVDKVKSAIERIRLAEMSQEPLYVCYSGGKDSKVIRRLCEMAGVNYELHYNLTSVDHPSVVREILDDKEVIVDIPREIAEGIYGAGYRKIDEPMKEAQK